MEHPIDYHEFRKKKSDKLEPDPGRQGGIGNLFLAQVIVVLLTAIILLFINIGSPEGLQGLKEFFKTQVQGDKGITQTVAEVFNGFTDFLTASSSDSGSAAAGASASNFSSAASGESSSVDSQNSSSASNSSSSGSSEMSSESTNSSISLPPGTSSLAMGMGGEENPLPLFRESAGLSEMDLTPLQTDFVVPLHGLISCGYGYRSHPITGLPDFHKGIDIPAEEGTPIAAFRDGTVIQAQASVSFGNFVAIQHDDNTITRYGHCSSLNVAVGDQVKAGDTIGFVGNTGYSTGNHCHFDISVGGVFIDPLKVLPSHVETGYVTV